MNSLIHRIVNRFRGKGNGQSAATARQRLQLVLLHDRSNLSEEKLTELKDRMIDLISQYVEIDLSGVEISVEQEDRTNLLVANIPLVVQRPHR